MDSAGTLHGDLVILGSAIPTLSLRKYPYTPPAPAPPAAPAPGANQEAAAPEKPNPASVLDLLAEQVVQSGVRAVDGSVIGDDSYFLDERYGISWAWDDLQWAYGAPVSALTFNDNTVDLTLKPDPQPAAPAQTAGEWSPPTDYYSLDDQHEDGGAGRPGATGAGAPARRSHGARLRHRSAAGTACGAGGGRPGGVYRGISSRTR